METNSQEFQQLGQASTELSDTICKFLAEHELDVPNGLSALAYATLSVIEALGKAIEEEPKKILHKYMEGLAVGFHEKSQLGK